MGNLIMYKKHNGSRSFQLQVKALNRGRLRALADKPCPDYLEPLIFPEVRRRITIESFECGKTVKHVFELIDTKNKERVDSYYLRVDGQNLYINRRNKIVKTETRERLVKGWSKAMRFAEGFFIRIGRHNGE
jgi:hypothetical protein